MTSSAIAPTGPYTLKAADVTHDPYPLYHAIRACAPVYFDPQLERWLITGYREVASVLADQRFSSKGAARLSRPGQQADHSSTHTEPGTQHDPERPSRTDKTAKPCERVPSIHYDRGFRN